MPKSSSPPKVKNTSGGRYQIKRMTPGVRRERDRLLFQILDAVRILHAKKLIRSDDLIIEQDAIKDDEILGDSSISPLDIGFYKEHPGDSYRMDIVIAVRAKDRS